MAQYAVDSMRMVFGVRVDDPVAMMTGMPAQAPDGSMNASEPARLAGKNHSRTMTALQVLLDESLIVREDRPTGGRPAKGYRRLSG